MVALTRDYTIVIVTHHMQQAARVSDRTAFFTPRRPRPVGPPRDAAPRVSVMASPRIISDSIVVDTSAEAIFAILADPSAHSEIDGSQSLQGVTTSQTGRRLALGDRFGMNMKIGLPYKVKNTVVEYDENRLIAWQHFAKHTWRYELDELAPGRTRVSESWDWSGSPVARLMELVGFPDRNRKGIGASLVKLKALAEKRAAEASA